MRGIQLENGQVVINDQHVFLYGGEVHYFRIPKTEWRSRLLAVKAAGCNLISTYVPWLWHEVVEGEIDLQGRTTPERDLVTFLELIQECGMFCLLRPGPYVMSELENSGIPQWVEDNYPQTLAQQQNGEIHPTRVMSYLEPTFLALVTKWYQAICEVVAPRQIQNGGVVVMFQVDNEVGMLQWVTNQADYHPLTLTRFTQYCQQKWTTLETMNQNLNTNFDNYTQLVAAMKRSDVQSQLQYEYRLFMREDYKQYLETLIAIAKSFGVHLPWVVNIHGFDNSDYAKRGKQYPIGLSQLLLTAEIPDVVLAGDYYIGNIVPDNYFDITLANAFTEAIQPETQPLFSAEFQGGFQHAKPKLQPTTIDLSTRLCLANGMKALNYYMFAGGENYEGIGLLGRRHDWQAPIGMNGEIRRHYHHITHIGKLIQAIEPELLAAKLQKVTYLGFYPDYYMTEYTAMNTAHQDQTLKRYREAYLYEGMGKGLIMNNFTVGGINLSSPDEIDVETVSSLWVLSSEWMAENIQKKLVNYIKNGGQLIIWPKLPEFDFYQRPCTLLRDYINVQVENIVPEQFGVFGPIDSVSGEYTQVFSGTGLEVIATLESKPEQCCGFSKRVDQGKVIVLGCGLEYDYEYKKDVLLQLTNALCLEPIVEIETELDISIQKSGEIEFVFIQNYDDYEKETTLKIQQQPLFSGKKLVIPAKTGRLLLRNFPLIGTSKIIESSIELIDRTITKSDISLTFAAQQEGGWLELEGVSRVKAFEASGKITKIAIIDDKVSIHVGSNETIQLCLQ
ncbi:MAG: beta-galactosidase [Culicoidibacterales bacterium]